MKKTVVFFFLGLLAVMESGAQAVSSGIYLTSADFSKNKLIEEADCKKDKEEFKTHELFNRQSFEVIYEGQKRMYPKSMLYAYRDCSNRTWRFYDNREYELVEAKAIYIYRQKKVVMNGLTVEKDPVYYFSVGAEGAVRELTVENLEAAFPANRAFRNAVNDEFRSGRPLQSFDLQHKMYLVNYLLEQSEK